MDTTLLIGDIVERDSKPFKPETFGEASSSTGFPQPKRRWRQSRFKQEKAAGGPANTSSDNATSTATSPGQSKGPAPVTSFDELERERIDRENKQKLDSMSPEEIAQAQEDIMNGLNPALIQRLLQRAHIDEDASTTLPPPTATSTSHRPSQSSRAEAESGHAVQSEQEVPASTTATQTAGKPKKQVKFVEEEEDDDDDDDEDRAPSEIPPDLIPATELPKNTHFPAPRTLPDLDPADPNFLATLHEKYFPDLPADPSKLAWMAPVPSAGSVADQESPYYPHPEIAVSALRFDFRGRFLPPRLSRSIPVSQGLHHHGEAPEAAGYTVAELAHLARSAVPAQRCMAYQTLGRVLYRLGQGEWGKTVDDPIAMGVWSAVKQGRVLDSLTEASMGEGGHQGSRAYATEALWLFEKGGWKEKFKGR